MALINELFEKALDAVSMLDGDAFTLLAILRGETGCGVELLAHMRELLEVVEEKGEDCIEQLDGLTRNVEASETSLGQASDATQHALESVAAEAPAVTARAEAMETHTQEVVTESSSERTQASATLQEGLVQAREDAARATTAAEVLGALLATRIEEARKALGELQHATSEARSVLGAAAQRLLDAAAEVESTCTAGAGLYLAGIDALTNEEATHLTNLANAKVDSHNLTMGPLRHRMAEDEPRALHEMVQAVIQHMQSLLALCDQRDDALVASAEKCEPLADGGGSKFDLILHFTEFVLTI